MNFFKAVTKLSFDTKPSLPPNLLTSSRYEEEAKVDEEPSKKAALSNSKFVIGNYRSDSRLSESGEMERPKENSNSNKTVRLVDLHSELRISSEASLEAASKTENKNAESENEWQRSWSKIVAMIDKEEDEEPTKQSFTNGTQLASSDSEKSDKDVLIPQSTMRDRGFKRGLELGINSINKLAKANFVGIHYGGTSVYAKNLRSATSLMSTTQARSAPPLHSTCSTLGYKHRWKSR